MRRVQRCSSFTPLFWIGLILSASLALSSLPQTYASPDVLEKFPTSTSVVVAGWNNPTNVYAEDSVYADSYTNNAEQEYGGFGFNFNATDTIENVWIAVKFIVAMSILEGKTAGEFVGYVKAYQYDAVPAPLKWKTMRACDYEVITDSGLDNATAFQLDMGYPLLIEITAYFGTYDRVNNLLLRLRCSLPSGDGFYWQVDSVSVIVAYTTTTDESMEQYMFLGFVIALIPIAVVFFYPRSQKQLEETQS